MNVLIDYLTMTSKIHDYKFLLESFGLENCPFLEWPGRNGWKYWLYYQGVSVYFGGDRAENDVCIELSGTGCRTVEQVSNCSFDWVRLFDFFLDDLKSRQVHFSRLDVAGDDRDNILSYRNMARYCAEGKYICKARRKFWTDGDEQSIYFGADTSDRRLRIYNKALEQGIQGNWIRCEMQMRNDNATSFLLNWIGRKEAIGACYGAVLKDYLRFTRTVPDGSHYDRCEVTRWWDKFLGAVRQCRQLYLDGGIYTLQSVQDFLKRQAASSLKLWLEANHGDFTDIAAMIEGARLNYKQQQLLDKIVADISDKYIEKVVKERV